MNKLICKFFRHIPKKERLVFSSNNSELKTFEAECGRCGCKLFGKEDRGEFSGELIKVFISVSNS